MSRGHIRWNLTYWSVHVTRSQQVKLHILVCTCHGLTAGEISQTDLFMSPSPCVTAIVGHTQGRSYLWCKPRTSLASTVYDAIKKLCLHAFRPTQVYPLHMDMCFKATAHFGPRSRVFNRRLVNDNDNRIQRRYSRFFTISSQRRELSPTRTLKWPVRYRVQITCSTSSAYHVQVSCYVPLGTKGQPSYEVWQSWNRIYLSFILLAEPLNRWRRGGHQSTRRKPLATRFRSLQLTAEEPWIVAETQEFIALPSEKQRERYELDTIAFFVLPLLITL